MTFSVLTFFFSNMSDNIQQQSPRAINGIPTSLSEKQNDPMKSAEILDLVTSYFQIKKYHPKAANLLRFSLIELAKTPSQENKHGF